MIKETAPQVSVSKSILEDRIKNIKIICMFMYHLYTVTPVHTPYLTKLI